MQEIEFDCNGMHEPTLGVVEPATKKKTLLGFFLVLN